MLEYKKIFSYNFTITKDTELNFAANFGNWIFGCHLVVSGVGCADDWRDSLSYQISFPQTPLFRIKWASGAGREGVKEKDYGKTFICLERSRGKGLATYH